MKARRIVEAMMDTEQDLEFARSYTPKKQASVYDWVVEHAKERTDVYLRLADTLDSKADRLTTFIGALALVYLGALPASSESPLLAFVLAVPGLLLLLRAGTLTMKAIRPRGTPFFPAIQKAYEYADFFADDAALRYFTTSVTIEKRFKRMLDDKSSLIQSGYRWFWFALVWLPIPLLLPKLNAWLFGVGCLL